MSYLAHDIRCKFWKSYKKTKRTKNGVFIMFYLENGLGVSFEKLLQS